MLIATGVPTRTPVPGEPGEFITHVDLTVVGGSGKYAEATGTMTFDGVSHTGTVPQTVDLIYKGTVCGPNVKGSELKPLAWEQVEMGRRIGVPQPFARPLSSFDARLSKAPKLPAFALATHRQNANVWRRLGIFRDQQVTASGCACKPELCSELCQTPNVPRSLTAINPSKPSHDPRRLPVKPPWACLNLRLELF